MWTPNFFCLAESDQDTVPSTVAAKEALVQSVLGEKKVEVEEELSPQQFKEVIIENFPKLKDSGGFELLRCRPNSRQLEPISFTVASSPKLLKTIIGNSRIYIRPIQCNLDTSPAEVEDDTLLAQKVHKYMSFSRKSVEFPLPELRNHTKACKWNLYPGTCSFKHIYSSCFQRHQAKDCSETPSDSTGRRSDRKPLAQQSSCAG